MTLTTDLLETPEQIRDILPEWLAFLETQPIGTSVYNHPEYLLAHFRHNPEGSQNLQIAIVVVREQGTIVCIAPLSIQDHTLRLTLSVRKLFSICIRQMRCPGSSFIFAKDQNVFACFDAVFETLERSNIRFDLLMMWGLRNNSPFWDYCTTRLTGKPYRFFNVLAGSQSDLRIHFPDSMETLLVSTGKKKRKNVRRTLDHFHKSVKEFRLERITESSQVETFFDNMMKIAANSWQGKTFGLTDWKTEARLKCWKEIADGGFLRSYILWADNKPIAYRRAYQHNGIFYGQEVGYDHSAADLSPGIVCLYYCLDDLMTYQSPKTFDFDCGSLGNKRLFANEEIESALVYIAGSAKGAMLAHLQTFLNRFTYWAKGLLQKWNFASRIRKILKHKT